MSPSQTKIILIAGPQRSGKSTVADYLAKVHSFRHDKFAATIKDMLRVLGLEDDHIEGDLKEVECELLGGQTPRFAMQTLGTDWGRDLMSPNIWIDAIIQRAHTNNRPVVIDDVRFPNEVEAFKDRGAFDTELWYINPAYPGYKAAKTGHESEMYLAQLRSRADIVIENLAGPEYLCATAKELV